MNSKRLTRLFNVAKNEALKSTYKVQLGAVIFNKNDIISKGFNSVKTHPRMVNHNEYATIHAEMAAIINAKDEVRGCSIFVCRLNKSERPLLAKPCENCQRIMKQCGIKEVYFTINEFPYYNKMRLQ